MPRYRYTGTYGAVFMDLQLGVNASVFGPDGAESTAPEGSTVVLESGDQLDTFEPYPHAALELLPDAPPPASPEPAPAPTDPAPADPGTEQPQETQA